MAQTFGPAEILGNNGYEFSAPGIAPPAAGCAMVAGSGSGTQYSLGWSLRPVLMEPAVGPLNCNQYFAADRTWKSIPPIESGSVVGALGYTPVNKAGDTMSGPLVVPRVNNGASQFDIGNVEFSSTSPISIPATGNVQSTRSWVMGFGQAGGASLNLGNGFYIYGGGHGLSLHSSITSIINSSLAGSLTAASGQFRFNSANGVAFRNGNNTADADIAAGTITSGSGAALGGTATDNSMNARVTFGVTPNGKNYAIGKFQYDNALTYDTWAYHQFRGGGGNTTLAWIGNGFAFRAFDLNAPIGWDDTRWNRVSPNVSKFVGADGTTLGTVQAAKLDGASQPISFGWSSPGWNDWMTLSSNQLVLNGRLNATGQVLCSNIYLKNGTNCGISSEVTNRIDLVRNNGTTPADLSAGIPTFRSGETNDIAFQVWGNGTNSGFANTDPYTSVVGGRTGAAFSFRGDAGQGIVTRNFFARERFVFSGQTDYTSFPSNSGGASIANNSGTISFYTTPTGTTAAPILAGAITATGPLTMRSGTIDLGTQTSVLQRAELTSSGGGLDIYTGAAGNRWQFFHNEFMPGSGSLNLGSRQYSRSFNEIVGTTYFVGGAAGPRLDSASGAVRVRSNDGLADAPITASNLTAPLVQNLSGILELRANREVHIRPAAGTSDSHVMTLRVGGSFGADGVVIQQGGGGDGVITGSGSFQINAATSTLSLFGGFNTNRLDVGGDWVTSRTANGFRSRNLANNADAPITASTGTFSQSIQVQGVSNGGWGDIRGGGNGLYFTNNAGSLSFGVPGSNLTLFSIGGYSFGNPTVAGNWTNPRLTMADANTVEINNGTSGQYRDLLGRTLFASSSFMFSNGVNGTWFNGSSQFIGRADRAYVEILPTSVQSLSSMKFIAQGLTAMEVTTGAATFSGNIALSNDRTITLPNSSAGFASNVISSASINIRPGTSSNDTFIARNVNGSNAVVIGVSGVAGVLRSDISDFRIVTSDNVLNIGPMDTSGEITQTIRSARRANNINSVGHLIVRASDSTQSSMRNGGDLTLRGGDSISTITNTGGRVLVHGGTSATSSAGNVLLAHTGSAAQGKVLVGKSTDDDASILQVAGAITCGLLNLSAANLDGAARTAIQNYYGQALIESATNSVLIRTNTFMAASIDHNNTTFRGNLGQGFLSVTPSFRSSMLATGQQTFEVGNGSGTWQTAMQSAYGASLKLGEGTYGVDTNGQLRVNGSLWVDGGGVFFGELEAENLYLSGAVYADFTLEQGYMGGPMSARSRMLAAGQRASEVGDGSGAWSTVYREDYNGGVMRFGWGSALTPLQSIAAAATDAASTQTLANSIRTILLNLGLVI